MSLADILDDRNLERLVQAVARRCAGSGFGERYWKYKPPRLLVLVLEFPEDRIGRALVVWEMAKVIEKDQLKALVNYLAPDMTPKEVDDLLHVTGSNRPHKLAEEAAQKEPKVEKLSKSARILYGVICNLEPKPGKPFPTTVEALVGASGLSKSSVLRAIKQLAEVEVIEWVPGNGKVSRSTMQRFV